MNSKKSKIKAESKAEQANESPAQTDFDALNRKSNESGGARADLDNLFGATFALEKWLFIARGSLPNINPYIAANADYADGQQMIRAFTDSDRLQRFAAENNLTDANGSAQMLEIPVKGAVEYLEQFIQHGTHDVWFNSDTESDGYFIPLKQLRPIKEHLASINLKSTNEPMKPDSAQNSGFVPPVNSNKSGGRNLSLETAIVTLKDGLMLPSGFTAESSYQCLCFCRIPKDWTDSERVSEAGLEKIFEKLYGENWRAGNSDGSRYVVLGANSKVFTSDEAQVIRWGGTVNTDENHFFFFISFENGELKSVTEGEFETDILLSNRVKDAADDENFDGYIDWFRRGTIIPDTTFKPFFRAIAPLLADYAGAGEFEFSFATGSDKPGMRDLFEDVSSNSHGAYLKYRSYIFEPYEMQMIGTNRLTNVRTGEKLRIQLTMHKNLADQKTTLIVVFVGRSATIETLENAVKSALDAAEYKVQIQTKKAATTETLQSIGVQG